MPQPVKFEYETFEIKMRHVLLIDDDQQALALYKEMLEANNCVVSTFTSGVEALKKIMEADVEAIFCDLMMPTMAGDMFYKAVERVRPHLCPRFVFVTGYQNHPRFQDFIKKEKPVVLYKPVTMGKLIGTLNLVCKRAEEKPPPPVL